MKDSIEALLEYPRSRDIKFVLVSLCDVRAADSIRVSFDFERDGWKIEQASKFEFHIGEPVDSDWREVAFVPAWGRFDPAKNPITAKDF